MLPTTRSNRSPTPLSTTRRHSPFVHSNSRRHPPLRHHHSRTSTISTPQPPPSTPPPPQPNHLNTINNITSSPPTTVAAIITHQHHPHCYAVLTTTTIMIRVRFILIVTPMVCLAVISTERMRLDLDSAQGKRNESCDMCFNLDAELLKSQNAHNDLLKSSKDRPPMLAPGNYIQWKSRIKRYIDTKPNRELIHFCLTNPPYELGWKEKFVLDSEGNPTTATQQVFETYKNVTQDIRDQLNAEVEAVQIILTGIDNDIYSTVDARVVFVISCLFTCNNMQTQRSNTLHNAIMEAGSKDRPPMLAPDHNKLLLGTEENQLSTLHNPSRIEPSMVAEDGKTSKDKEIDKLMALISLSFKKIYKPTNNNLRTSSNTSRANQDNSPRINRSVGYENQ
nr:hypothetical protein [Tanacetum cinerariifolium]